MLGQKGFRPDSRLYRRSRLPGGDPRKDIERRDKKAPRHYRFLVQVEQNEGRTIGRQTRFAVDGAEARIEEVEKVGEKLCIRC